MYMYFVVALRQGTAFHRRLQAEVTNGAGAGVNQTGRPPRRHETRRQHDAGARRAQCRRARTCTAVSQVRSERRSQFFRFLNFNVTLLFCSRSPNGLASDLEGVGLGDIRTLVKLMCLVAPHAKTSTSSTTSKGRRDVSKSDELANLSAAIGALAQNDAASSQLLVQLCTQVRRKTPRMNHN